MTGDMDADVIIIGAGILGGLAALHLAQKGKSVLILEAGPRIAREKLLEYFRHSPDKTNFDAFYPELPWAPKSGGGSYSDQYIENDGPMRWAPGMLRLYGGTTWHWSGAFWRYIPNDFRMQTLYGCGRDWPVSYDDLEPWYTLAENLTGCSGVDSDDQAGNVGKPYRRVPHRIPCRRSSGAATHAPWPRSSRPLERTSSMNPICGPLAITMGGPPAWVTRTARRCFLAGPSTQATWRWPKRRRPAPTCLPKPSPTSSKKAPAIVLSPCTP